MNFDKTIIAKNFSRGATKYDELAQVQKMAAEKLVAFTSPFIKPNSQILDLGSGTSFITKEIIKTNLHSKFFEVDISSEMLNSWHSRPSNIIPIQADMENLPQNFPFEPNFFDVIFSSFAMHWVCDFTKIFTHIFSLLKPGGTLAICLPCHKSLDELRLNFHINQFPKNNDLKSLFKQLGFEKKIFSNETIKQNFPSQFAALKFLKEIGANYPSDNLKIRKQDLHKTQFFEEFERLKNDKIVFSENEHERSESPGRENFCEGSYKDIRNRSKNFSDTKITEKVGSCVSPDKNFCLKNFTSDHKNFSLSWNISYFVIAKP